MIAENEVLIPLMEAPDEILRWQEHQPLSILVASHDTAGGERHLGSIALAAPLAWDLFLKPLHDGPGRAFEPSLDLILGDEPSLQDLELKGPDSP